MARITRKQQKIFAGSATNNGVFGSLQENNPTYSNDPDTIQGRPAYEQGWNGATYSSELLPPLEEFQALQYLFSRQIAYLLQDGVAEWNTATPYYKGSIVKTISGTNIKLFRSLADNNTGNQTTDTSKWALIYDSQNPYANSNFDNITDFSKNISNWSTNTTNCITEIPQDINLELSNGTLTLKAGSKVYVPNGAGTFNTVTITNDLTYTSSSNGKRLVFAGTTGTTGLQSNGVNLCVSGATDSLSGQTYHTWYDTTNNVIKYYASSGSTVHSNRSFPIAIVTVSNGAISSIDQVFNGIGYIGSTIYVLPNVSALIAAGRNSDGSPKTTTKTTTTVITRTGVGTSYDYYCVSLHSGSYLNYSSIYYVAEDGYLHAASGAIENGVVFARYSTDSNGNVTLFEPKTVFNATDYFDPVLLVKNQTIRGVKSFMEAPYVLNATTGGRYYIKNTGLDLTAATRTSDVGMGIRNFDKNDNITGEFATYHTTTGNSYAQMQIRNRASGSQVSSQIRIGVDQNGNVYTLAPTPDATSSKTSTKIATTGWCNDPDLSTNLVHRTDDETIDGSKTFTSSLTMQAGTQYPNAFMHKNTLIPNNYTSPSSDVNAVIAGLYSNAGDFCAFLRGGKSTAGVTSMSLNVRNRASSSGSNRDVAMGLYIDSSGNVYTSAPTPSSATDNSTKIATTAWVKNFIAAAATKTTITGYCVPNYGSAVTITSPYTPAKNGIIIAKSTSSYSTCEIAKGTTTISRANCADNTSSTNAVWAIVKSGEQYTVTATGTATLLFVPFVGG